jgi:hypothetical protein
MGLITDLPARITAGSFAAVYRSVWLFTTWCIISWRGELRLPSRAGKRSKPSSGRGLTETVSPRGCDSTPAQL